MIRHDKQSSSLSAIVRLGHRARIIAASTTLLLLAASASATETTVDCIYVIRRHDNLSAILQKAGVDGRKSEFNLYGPKEWVRRNQALNPHITNWNDLPVGGTLTLQLPATLPCPGEQPKPAPIPPPPETSMPPSEEPKAPEPELPPPSPPIPPAEQAEGSGIDFDQLRNLLASVVTVRYARSLEGDDYILLSKISAWSVVYESRFAPFQKLRIYFDFIPRVSESFLGEDYHLESSRLQAGRAFIWDLWSVAEFDLVPKIGYWRYASVMPLKSSRGIEAVELGFSRQLSLGFDVGVSKAVGPVVSRIWHGRDLSLGFIRRDADSAGGQTYRTGAEFLIKGPGFDLADLPISSAFTLFFMNEAVLITRGQISKITSITDTVRKQDISDPDREQEVAYNVNYLGFGLGLIW